ALLLLVLVLSAFPLLRALLSFPTRRSSDLVNDTFGHHLGDVLLQQVGPRIMGQLRESDTVARLGGDEFAVVLPTADDEAGATLADRKSTRLNSSHRTISYAVLCLKQKTRTA